MTSERVGNYCRDFRKVDLELTLEEFSTDINMKTLSAFENGRSTNIDHIFKYMEKCKTEDQLNRFIDGLGEIMRSDIYADF